MATTEAKKDITIIGGGIIGCTTAYYLTRHPLYDPALHRITLLEASASSSTGGRTQDSIKDPAELAYPSSSSIATTAKHDNDDGDDDETSAGVQRQLQQKFNPAHDGIASGASGKAGGLLALWAFPSNIVPLSFRLHEELAKEHGGGKRWGYRRCWASQVECRARLPGSLVGAAAAAAAPAGAEDEGGESKADNAEGNTKGLHKDHKKSAAALRKLGVPEDLDWVVASSAGKGGSGSGGKDGPGLTAYENIGTPDNTAQVHPELFTRSMAALAEEKGVRIITSARVLRINTITTSTGEPADKLGNTDRGQVSSVTYTQQKPGGGGPEETTLPTTHVVLAAGPWTPTLLPSSGPHITTCRAHSVVIQPAEPVSAYALFTAITLPKGFPAPTSSPSDTDGSGGETPADRDEGGKPRRLLKHPTTVEPEIYARPDGTAYACGPTDTDVPLPEVASDVQVDEARCADIVRQVGAISDRLDSSSTSSLHSAAKVLARQACYLPQGGPWIGPVPGFAAGGPGGGGVGKKEGEKNAASANGVVVAAGHTCWGIQNAPATGKLVSEIVLEGEARSARLGGCDPSRVM